MNRHPNPRGGDGRLTAVICNAGHEITGRLEETGGAPDFCERCGSPTMAKCERCGARILGDYEDVVDLSSHPPPSNCTGCGKPFPWREAAIRRAENVARMQSEIHELDERTARQLMEFAKDIAERRATPEETATFAHWFKKKAGREASVAVGGVLRDVATSTISEIIRKLMIGA